MNDEISLILGKCLEAIEMGELTPLDCLDHYPEHRDELIPLLEGAHYLKTWASAKPSVTFQAVARQRLLRKLPPRAVEPDAAADWLQQVRNWWQTAVDWLFQPAQRPVMATSLAALICLMGLGLLSSGRALPGEPLYGLKTTVEQVRLGVSDEHRQQQLQLEFAQRRLVEIETLLVTGETETAVRAAQARLPEAVIDGDSLFLHLADEHLRLAAEQASQGDVETASTSIESYARNMAVVVMTFEDDAPDDAGVARLATLEMSLSSQQQLIDQDGFGDEALAIEARTVLAEASLLVTGVVTVTEVDSDPPILSETPVLTPTVGVTGTVTAVFTATPIITQTVTPAVSATPSPASEEATITSTPDAEPTGEAEAAPTGESSPTPAGATSDPTATPLEAEATPDSGTATPPPPADSPEPVDDEDS